MKASRNICKEIIAEHQPTLVRQICSSIRFLHLKYYLRCIRLNKLRIIVSKSNVNTTTETLLMKMTVQQTFTND